MGKAGKAIQSTHLKHKRAVKEGRDEKEGRSRRGGRQKARRRPILKVLKRTDFPATEHWSEKRCLGVQNGCP